MQIVFCPRTDGIEGSAAGMRPSLLRIPGADRQSHQQSRAAAKLT
jgi:hypothetical protein